MFLPAPNFVIKPSDVLVVIGREKDLMGVQDWKKPRRPRRLSDVPLDAVFGPGGAGGHPGARRPPHGEVGLRGVPASGQPGFLQEGVTRELGAAVRMGGNLPLPASCPRASASIRATFSGGAGGRPPARG